MAVVAAATSASAVTFFTVDDAEFTKMFLNDASDATTDFGSFGVNDNSHHDFLITTNTKSDFSNGFATIKPNPHDGGTLTDIVFTPTSPTAYDGFDFHDMPDARGTTVVLTVTDQLGRTETFDFTEPTTGDQGPLGIIRALAGETISRVELFDASGFKQVKQITWEGVPATVPEPATWALMVGGIGFAGATLRRRRAAAVA
jgi:hypothetical protein